MISFWIFFGLRRSILKCESASPQDPSQPRSYCLCLWSWNEALWLYIGLSLVFCRWCKQFSLKILTYLYKVRSGNFEVHRKTFYRPLKKKFWRLSVQRGLRGSNDLRVGWKMATFQLFFQSREQVVVRRGQMRRIGWVIKTLEAQVGQFLLGCKCPVSRGIVVQE